MTSAGPGPSAPTPPRSTPLRRDRILFLAIALVCAVLCRLLGGISGGVLGGVALLLFAITAATVLVGQPLRDNLTASVTAGILVALFVLMVEGLLFRGLGVSLTPDNSAVGIAVVCGTGLVVVGAVPGGRLALFGSGDHSFWAVAPRRSRNDRPTGTIVKASLAVVTVALAGAAIGLAYATESHVRSKQAFVSLSVVGVTRSAQSKVVSVEVRSVRAPTEDFVLRVASSSRPDSRRLSLSRGTVYRGRFAVSGTVVVTLARASEPGRVFRQVVVRADYLAAPSTAPSSGMR